MTLDEKAKTELRNETARNLARFHVEMVPTISDFIFLAIGNEFPDNFDDIATVCFGDLDDIATALGYSLIDDDHLLYVVKTALEFYETSLPPRDVPDFGIGEREEGGAL